ncbi:hypothetical protein C1645_768455, partial [Glomus cerebriforme]
MTSEELPSPSEELRDVPFSRISKTIMKYTEEREEEELVATPKRRSFNEFKDVSPSSMNFGSLKINDSSPSLKGKNPEKKLKMSNTRKLNEKYAMMQQKMSNIAQEITYPRSTSSRNSKNSFNNIKTTHQIKQDDDQSVMANPFLINSSNTSNNTAGSLMSKWLDLNLDKRNLPNLIENLEQEISSDKIGRTNIFACSQTLSKDEV